MRDDKADLLQARPNNVKSQEDFFMNFDLNINQIPQLSYDVATAGANVSGEEAVLVENSFAVGVVTFFFPPAY